MKQVLFGAKILFFFESICKIQKNFVPLHPLYAQLDFKH